MRESSPLEEEVVRSLLHEQQPDLAGLPLRRVNGGWDNEVWRLGEELAVRLPRTERAPDLLRKEQRWLPVLAPRLPLPVPTPVRAGVPAARFAWPWAVTTWVPGEPGDLAQVTRGGHAADVLAGFLRALHREAPAEAPPGTGRGVPLRTLARDFDEKADGVTAGVRLVWEDAVAAPAWQGPRRWLHGDLHPANVVVSDGAPVGVLDFGDMCAGDPATDLSAAWLLLPAGAATRFFDSYGLADEATVRRARGWAVWRALGLVAIGVAGRRGLPGGKPAWEDAGRSALERVRASGQGAAEDRRAAGERRRHSR
jgi:aminoglycoside phosphotransferase (APT) family kinase protein